MATVRENMEIVEKSWNLKSTRKPGKVMEIEDYAWNFENIVLIGYTELPAFFSTLFLSVENVHYSTATAKVSLEVEESGAKMYPVGQDEPPVLSGIVILSRF